MSFAKDKKGPNGPRYSLPEEQRGLKDALRAAKLLETFQQMLSVGVQDHLPSTEDVLDFLKEALALSAESLKYEHWATKHRNPEVISSGQVIPSHEDRVVSKGSSDQYSLTVRGQFAGMRPAKGEVRTIAFKEGDQADDIIRQEHNDTAGQPESSVTPVRRFWQKPREPIELYRLLEAMRVIFGVASITASGLPKRFLRMASLIADFIGKVSNNDDPESSGSQSQGDLRDGSPRLGGHLTTIAGLANYARRLRRRR